VPIYGRGNKVVIPHPPTGPEEEESSMGRDSTTNSRVNNTEPVSFIFN